MSYIHPEERSTAERGIRYALEMQGLQGGVFRSVSICSLHCLLSDQLPCRVRFAHIPRMYRLNEGNSNDNFTDADYITVDLVINVAARGLVLCFIHSVTQGDDKPNAAECGRSHAAPAYLLYSRLLEKVKQPSNMDYVFQILLDVRGIRSLVLSWPPDLPQEQETNSRTLATFAEGIAFDTSLPRGTSCARRRKTRRTIYSPNGTTHDIESIFISYGEWAWDTCSSCILSCDRVLCRPSRLRLPPTCDRWFPNE